MPSFVAQDSPFRETDLSLKSHPYGMLQATRSVRLCGVWIFSICLKTQKGDAFSAYAEVQKLWHEWRWPSSMIVRPLGRWKSGILTFSALSVPSLDFLGLVKRPTPPDSQPLIRYTCKKSARACWFFLLANRYVRWMKAYYLPLAS